MRKGHLYSFYYGGYYRCQFRSRAAGRDIDEWELVRNAPPSVFASRRAGQPLFGYWDVSDPSVIHREALLARGAHGSLGAFMGFFLSSIGTLLMGLAMLIGRVFSRVTAWVGIVGITLLIIYTIGSTFVPESGEAMMVIALPGGLLLMVWNVMVAKKLFQLRAARGERVDGGKKRD